MESRLDIMQRMLEWRHIVPTAPDTLTSYPFPTSDPFMLAACPHVFFAGNQPEFAQRLVTGAGLRAQTPNFLLWHHVTRTASVILQQKQVCF